jgi:hypothetical protein
VPAPEAHIVRVRRAEGGVDGPELPRLPRAQNRRTPTRLFPNNYLAPKFPPATQPGVSTTRRPAPTGCGRGPLDVDQQPPRAVRLRHRHDPHQPPRARQVNRWMTADRRVGVHEDGGASRDRRGPGRSLPPGAAPPAPRPGHAGAHSADHRRVRGGHTPPTRRAVHTGELRRHRAHRRRARSTRGPSPPRPSASSPGSRRSTPGRRFDVSRTYLSRLEGLPGELLGRLVTPAARRRRRRRPRPRRVRLPCSWYGVRAEVRVFDGAGPRGPDRGRRDHRARSARRHRVSLNDLDVGPARRVRSAAW